MKQETKFKQTEIGIIPEEWDIKPVSEVSEISLGGTPKTSITKYWNGDIKWASAKDVSNCKSRYICNTERTVTKEGIDNSAAKILPENTIVITSRGTVGELALLSEPMSFNQTCYGLKAKENMDSLFLYYNLKNSISRIKSISYGTVFSTITVRTFDEIKLAYPTLNEQHRIAKILSDLDSKIELLQKQNKTLEAIAQTLFKHWFVDFEYPNEEGKPYKSSGGEMLFNEELGKEIPKGWEVGKLGDIIENFDSKRIPLSSRERKKRKGKFPYYGATKIIDYVDDYLFDGTYILMAEDGSVTDEVGYPVLQYVWGKFWANNHAHIIKGKGISTEFLYVLLLRTRISEYVTGAVQPKLNQANMNSIKILIPDSLSAKNFDNLIQDMFIKKKSLYEQIQSLQKIRDSLLLKLMSGKIRVPVEAE
ncbi:MAG: Type I restriction modification DNA specificity domain protein [Candidatus Argoarchaeum ethanivorans]|uniref:Type I restriction modification DNA specificity domain protein n=1 Tax=Candidatus Argoarchaeum ethanivorans TaxID=2608793 RepID=A0A811TB90_9EURY|nr:MAG: Type I restriction modification DNA specificity domain protein [Candidatus Argoarchaeum ethanivorans]